ncbi:MAG: HAMP domain-containing protein [Planctomycetes bacterium]|nr:HAMP domain-containing protein [Planctomycetota bacterium]
MTLNIAQRLTLTVALFGALVMGGGAWAFHPVLVHGMRATAIEHGNITALEVDHNLWMQLDKDLLSGFAGERVRFDTLHVPFTDWSVARGNGDVEAARGILQTLKRPGAGTPPEILSLGDDQVYVVASVELLQKASMTWTDLSSETRQTILSEVSDGEFIRAESDVIENRRVLTVQMLSAKHITELVVTEGGDLVTAQSNALPETLPVGMWIVDPNGRVLKNPLIVGWGTVDGVMLARVQGQGPEGETVLAAVNRLGEHYDVALDGSVGQKQDSTRLWLAVGSDISFQMAHARSLSQGIYGVMVFVWGLMILIAWQVSKRALKPVYDIVQQVEKIMPASLNERLPFRRVNDELSHLARTVNKMLDRIQAGYHREQQFTGDASHEMRNSLAKMNAEIDLALSKDRDSAAHKEILGRLKGYSEGMQQLTNSLLMLARLDGGLQTLDIDPFDVSDLVVATLKTLPKALVSRVHLDSGPSTYPMMAIAHESLMGVLIGNLLDNALRYSPADSLVYLRIHRRGKTLHFTIEDQGAGIPEDQRALVFNRFHRLDESRSKATGGHGLGLAIVRAIADVHHITIDLQSGVPQGTVVSFSLPARHE